MNAQAQPFVANASAAIILATDRSAGGAERQLLAAVERAARHPQGRVAIVLHLSGLYPPAPRPHHLRIARAFMHDVAERHEGQTFALRNGDVVLLCQVRAAATGPSHLAMLSATLERLFERDAPDAASLVSVWPLPQNAERLLSYTAARLAGTEAAAAEDAPGPLPDAVNSLDAVIGRAHPADLIRRQTAALLGPPAAGGAEPPGAAAEQIRPLFQELSFSLDILEGRIDAPGQITRDPFLLQHLAVRLDARMLEVLRDQRGRGGPLDPSGDAPLPLHLNLTPASLLSEAFAAFVAQCRDDRRPIAAEVLLMEATADPESFARARVRAAQLGVPLVLDGVSHLALLLACPGLLRPDLLKMDWSPRLPDLPAEDQKSLGEAIRQIGPARVILHRAETEAAIRWGLALGIRCFQGRHIDAMLAAARIVSCPVSGGCTLRQCSERASATGGAGRVSCRNLGLLDAGAPKPDRPKRSP